MQRMSQRHDPNWRCIGYQSGGQPFIIDGVNVAGREWTRVGTDDVTVKDLHDPIFLSLPIYEVVEGDKHIVFVAGQFHWDTMTYFLPVTHPE
jgi:hypothetical protein